MFVAFAVSPGWSESIEVFAAFVILDQIVSYLVEPFLIGRGIGLSPLGLLFSAMFWGWLWGLPGLLIATSLTACLKVAGDYIPALGFFAVLFGDDSAREDYHDYYRSLLELDQPSARNIAVRYCDKNGLEPTFDDVLIPAVILAGEERAENHISEQNQSLVFETTATLVKELGDRFNKPRFRGRLRIVGIAPPGEAHSLGLTMLLELLRRTGIAANFFGHGQIGGGNLRVCKRIRTRHGLCFMHHDGMHAGRDRAGARADGGIAASDYHWRRPVRVVASGGTARGRSHGNLRQQRRGPSRGTAVRAETLGFTIVADQECPPFG